MSGFAWYRFRVEVPPGMGRLGMELPPSYTDYEVFADGQRIGGFGGMTMANAGHLAPYLNGREMTEAADLPLGLDWEARFEASAFPLEAGDHLTVLTDGVPEATHNGQLFGFDRTAVISMQSASVVAEAARAYGQNDDITVLTVDVLGRDEARSPQKGSAGVSAQCLQQDCETS